MAAVEAPIEPLSDRDVRALTECMTALDDLGAVAGADGLYVVVSESGRSYTVDISNGACTCDDAFYRQPEGGCKHVRRVAFATERREIPAWVDRSAVDDQLGRHVCDEESH